MHAIGVLEGVTLLEFDGMSQEALEVQLTAEEPGEVVVECPNHKPCSFVKGKPGAL
jgi:hypothetical protein